MRYVTIDSLEQGTVLARPVMKDTGEILLNKGNKLTDRAIERIRDMSFQGAYIDEEMFQDIEVEDVIPTDLRSRAAKLLKLRDVQGCVLAAKEIVKELRFKDVLTLDLLDIKNDMNYIYKHSVAVSIYAVIIGIGMGLNEEQLENLAVAGLLQDIGVLSLREQVSKSPDKYDEMEMEEMKLHPRMAFDILKKFPSISSLSRNAILFHHENMDGTGYSGIKGEKLTIYSRIIRVVDVYDSMTADRKYRKANSPADTIEYIMANINTLFDKEVVEVFVSKFPLYPVGFTVLLSNGEKAVMMDNKKNSMRPIVRLFNGKNIDMSSEPEYRSVIIEGII